MRRLSLKDIYSICERECESIECVHSFGSVWVIDCYDGYWMTSKDCQTVEPEFRPALPKYVTALNTQEPMHVSIERSEREVFMKPLEVHGVEDYQLRCEFTSTQSYVGMEGAFDVYDIRDFEL